MLPSMSNLSIESKGLDADNHCDALPYELKADLASVYMKDGQFTLQYDAEPVRTDAEQKYMEELIRLQTLSQSVQLTSDHTTEALMTVIFDYLQDAGRLNFEVPLSSQIGQKMKQWFEDHPDMSFQIKQKTFQDGLLRVSFPLKLFTASHFETWLVQNARATFCKMLKVIVEHLLTLKTDILATISEEKRSFDHMFFLDIIIPALRRVLSTSDT